MQYVIHLAFLAFAGVMTFLGLIRVSRNELRELQGRPPCLVVANHPTLIDVVLIIAAMPQADCVVKQAAWQNPVLRCVLAAAGYLPNEPGDGLLGACAARLRRGRWLLLFPEGTRSPRGRLGRFHRGAARIALRSGSDILPVVVTCQPPALMRGQRWYDVPDRTMRFTLRVTERIRPRPLAAWSVPAGVVARQLTAEMRARYAQALGHV